MTTPREPLDVQPIAERAAQATPGPWHVWHYNGSHTVNRATNSFASAVAAKRQPPHQGTGPMDSPWGTEGRICDDLDYRQNRLPADPGPAPNAEFIAHARTDIPALLAEVQRLASENARLRQQLDGTYESIRDAGAAHDHQLAEMAGRLNGALADAARLRGLIAQAEWAAGGGDPFDHTPRGYCPWCDFPEQGWDYDAKRTTTPGHKPDCPAFRAPGEPR